MGKAEFSKTLHMREFLAVIVCAEVGKQNLGRLMMCEANARGPRQRIGIHDPGSNHVC